MIVNDIRISLQQEKTVYIHPVVYFNNTPVNSTTTYKHLGMILDSKLSYKNHLQSVFSRENKTIGLFRKLNLLSRKKYLVTIFKSFIRFHLDYGDVVHDRES